MNFVLSTFRDAITQAHTDDALRGRIQGCLTVALFGGPQLGNLPHGTAGAAFGPRVAVSVGGLLTVMSVAVIAWWAPEPRTAGRLDDGRTASYIRKGS